MGAAMGTFLGLRGPWLVTDPDPLPAPNGKYPANDYELAVNCCKKLEHTLRTRFKLTSGPDGDARGLYELGTNVRNGRGYRLPRETMARLKWICRWRNKLLHDYNQHVLEDRPRFIYYYEEILRVIHLPDKNLFKLCKKDGRRWRILTPEMPLTDSTGTVVLIYALYALIIAYVLAIAWMFGGYLYNGNPPDQM